MMKKRYYVIAALALAAVMTAGMGKAWAYFTTYAQAEGGYVISLGDRTNITEEFSQWTKHVAVTSDENSVPVYVRVKAFSGSQYGLVYTPEIAGDWSLGAADDDYYYYNKILNGGETTSTLHIKIENIPVNVEDGDKFNVVVIYESTPVLYDENGAALPADWNAKLDVITSTETLRKPETETTGSGTMETAGGTETSGASETSAASETTSGSGEGSGAEGSGES